MKFIVYKVGSALFPRIHVHNIKWINMYYVLLYIETCYLNERLLSVEPCDISRHQAGEHPVGRGGPHHPDRLRLEPRLRRRRHRPTCLLVLRNNRVHGAGNRQGREKRS